MKPYPTEVRAEAARLSAEGLGHKRIGKQLGIPPTTIFRWLHADYAERNRVAARERKENYRGECIDCGTATSWGSDMTPAERCASCRKVYEQTVLKLWTREAIIDAIRRFAAEHGRPPHATDWRRSDSERGYPAASSVYRNSGAPNAPFALWADAIEAAGFPRPRVGGYRRTPETLRRLSESKKAEWARRKAAA